VLSSQSYEAYYLRALKIRRLIKDSFESAFKSVDLIALPAALHVAGPINDSGTTADATAMYWEDFFTVQANLAGLPALTHPCGFVNQLPAGLQLIAPAFAEGKLLQAAHQYQCATDFHRILPPFAS
jgi:aspartyl-tRNA(Asn)/glutamyl-tRNA(Gln) amidotransferase subunit A